MVFPKEVVSEVLCQKFVLKYNLLQELKLSLGQNKFAISKITLDIKDFE